MNGWTVFILIAGVGAVSNQIMKLILWLDEPRRRRA